VQRGRVRDEIVNLDDCREVGDPHGARGRSAGEVDVNFEVVRRGGGWFDPEYAKDEELYIVENAARDAKVGLWALPLEKRMEPWEWRRLSKEEKARR